MKKIWVYVLVMLFLVGSASAYYKGKFYVYLGGGPVCGNNIVEAGEQCDGSDLGGKTCVSLGYDSGTLSCKSNCIYDTSDCTTTPAPGVGPTGGGGGSGRCIENWQCSAWSACYNGRQTRTCEDLNNCGTELLKPAESRTCTVEGKETEEESDLGILETQTEEPKSFFSKLTGAVIGGGADFYVPLIFILAIIIASVMIFVARKRKENS